MEILKSLTIPDLCLPAKKTKNYLQQQGEIPLNSMTTVMMISCHTYRTKKMILSSNLINYFLYIFGVSGMEIRDELRDIWMKKERTSCRECADLGSVLIKICYHATCTWAVLFHVILMVYFLCKFSLRFCGICEIERLRWKYMIILFRSDITYFWWNIDDVFKCFVTEITTKWLIHFLLILIICKEIERKFTCISTIYNSERDEKEGLWL